MRIAHLVGGLASGGGAEEMLYRLVLQNSDNEHIVISLQDKGYYGSLLEQQGVTVIGLGMSGTLGVPVAALSLFKVLKQHQPDVLQTWMYYSDLLGAIVGRLAGVRNIVWGIHHSTMESDGSSLSSRVSAKLCALISSVAPSKIISCSNVGAKVHIEKGYARSKMIVAYNGYDTDAFKPADGKANSLRAEYAISSDTQLVGMVARDDPQKDHDNLFKAAKLLLERGFTDWRCILLGVKMDSSNQVIVDKIERMGLQSHIILGGLRSNISSIVRELDLKVLSSSFGEAFPNVLNEAMASGVPCVTTDVGDASIIVGDTGWVVPPRNSEALADGIITALTEMREQPDVWQARRKACRNRVEENFTIQAMSDNYEAVWRSSIDNT